MVMEHQSQNVPVEGLCLPRRYSSFFFRLLPKIWFSTKIRRHCSHRNQQKLHRITFEFSFNWGSDQNRVVSEYSPKFPTMQTNGTRSVRLTKSCSFPHVVKCVRSASLPSRNKLPFSFFFPKSAFSCPFALHLSSFSLLLPHCKCIYTQYVEMHRSPQFPLESQLLVLKYLLHIL